ncbi:hypothetical protein BJ741DRAFT_665428 [Chytriomyces cf. hyalinus JEL632]|nr:hypothetical protein BJ741DRAFT_665428 [Chytriomyces cf. hyalinus JEL632]
MRAFESSATYPFAYSSSSGNHGNSNINSGTVPAPVDFQMRAAIVTDAKTTVHWIQPYAVSNAFAYASHGPRRALSKSKLSASSSGMGLSVEQDEDGPALLFGVAEKGGIRLLLMLKTVYGTQAQLDIEAFQGRVEVSHIAKLDSDTY